MIIRYQPLFITISTYIVESPCIVVKSPFIVVKSPFSYGFPIYVLLPAALALNAAPLGSPAERRASILTGRMPKDGMPRPGRSRSTELGTGDVTFWGYKTLFLGDLDI